MTESFQILDDRSHVQMRMGMYIGSPSLEELDRFLLGKWTSISYVPAIVKMVDEIIDNSVDEAIRTKFKHANIINVEIDLDSDGITISDNGRGIPIEKIKDVDGKEIYRPFAAWTKTKAGSNFDDSERMGIGMNGVGSSVVNFCSSNFSGITYSGGKKYHLTCTDGCAEYEENVTENTKNKGTLVSFVPDFKLFGVESLRDFDIVSIVEDRLNHLSVAFPKIKFNLNVRSDNQTTNKNIASNPKVLSYRYKDDNSDGFHHVSSKNLDMIFVASQEGKTNSYVNGVNTRQGGSYVDFVYNSICDELISIVRKKHKVDISRALIKSNMNLVMFVHEFNSPKFDSQTKERLTNSIKDIREHYEKTKQVDFDKIAKDIFANPDLIEPIIEAQLAKKLAAEKRAATLAQKKAKKVKIAKHVPAEDMDSGTLFLVEGDCLHENQEVLTLNGNKKIKDIEQGDFVFTHKNRFKKVESKNFALKDSIRINGIVSSPEHRYYVYDKENDEFKFLEAKFLDKNKHQLVRNRFVYHGMEKSLKEVLDKKKSGILILENHQMQFSLEHPILRLNKNLEIEETKFEDIRIGDAILF